MCEQLAQAGYSSIVHMNDIVYANVRTNVHIFSGLFTKLCICTKVQKLCANLRKV